MTRKLLITALTGVCAAALPGLAAAQDIPPSSQAGQPTTTGTTAPQQGSTEQAALPDDAAQGDIVVTAQRRTERVVDVPISITVANQAQLEREQVNTVNDLNRIAPSLEIQAAPNQNTGGGGQLRGIGTQTFANGAVASVGIVVDQVSQGNANITNLFDVARIEVLKGPQGTLFGLTTSGGVINITTNAPDPSGFSARLRTELSGQGIAGSKFGDQIIQGLVNVPLGQDAALRVSATGNLRQGVDRDAYTNHYDDNNNYSVRGRFLWKPTDRLTVNLIGDWAEGTTENGGDFFTFVRASGLAVTPFGFPDNLAARLASCGVVASEGNQSYCTHQDIITRTYNYGASAQIDYDAGPLTLTSISAYRDSKNRGPGASANVFRVDPAVLQVSNPLGNGDLQLFTQEFRATSPSNQPVEFTLGAFGSHQIQRLNPSSVLVTLSPAPGVVIPVQSTVATFQRITDDSLAGFGQATAHLFAGFRLIGGIRLTSEKIANTQTQLSVTQFSYRAGAQYDLMRNTMVYATVSHGYKGGQIAVNNLGQAYTLRPEVPQDYEVGLKSTLFGGWVADLNFFYDTIQNYQAQQCVTTNTGAINCFSSNIDGVRTRGGELDLFGRVTQGLSVNTGFIYAKATYPNNYVGTDGTNIGGTQLAYAPEEKFTFSGEYEHQVASGFKGFFAADTVWKSRIRFEANSVPESTFRPHWTVGGRVGVRTADDRFQLAVFARNLFNVHEPVLLQSSFPYPAIGATGANPGANVGAIYSTGSFRQLGLSLDGKF